MTVETRYFRSGYLLLTDMGASALWIDAYKIQWGIRVWKGVLELTAGVPAAVITYYEGAGELSNTWVCPGSSLSGEVIVKLYAKNPVDSVWDLMATFQTNDMNDKVLDASTWTVVYHCEALYDEYGFFAGSTFGYNHTTWNSRIQNFTYTAVGIASKRLLVGVGI